MKIRANWDVFARHLEAGGRPECVFEFLEIGKAGLLRRFRAQQRPKRSAVNDTGRGLIPDREDQGLDVGAPASFLFQVETARPRTNGSIRRTISQATKSPISHTIFNNPRRATMAFVKTPAPPRKGVAANNVSSYAP